MVVNPTLWNFSAEIWDDQRYVITATSYHRQQILNFSIMSSYFQDSKEQCKPLVNFIDCWITHVLVLPSVERHKCNRFLNCVLTEIRRLAFQDILSISTAIVSSFGLTPICKKSSGNSYTTFPCFALLLFIHSFFIKGKK